MPEGRYSCENCQKISQTFERTYNFRAVIMDGTGSLSVDVIGNETGEQILGQSPFQGSAELNPAATPAPTGKTAEFQSDRILLWKEVSLLVRARLRSWQNQLSIEYLMVKSCAPPLLPHPIGDDNLMLIRTLSQFKCSGSKKQ